MAEPQVHSDGDRNSARESSSATQKETGQATGAAKAGQAAEARSFGQGGAQQGRALQAERYAPETAYDLAETGRRAGRNVADAWSRSFDPFMAFQMDMNRWFDDLLRQTTGLGVHAPLRAARPMAAINTAALMGLPPADLRETDKAYELAVELPGMAKDDIEVAIDRDALIVRGQKAEHSNDGGCAYRVSERRFGRFERAFPLPDDIDRGRIGATFKDGLLAIDLPKTEESSARRARIEIK
jgi:HSP20 family protein